MVRPKGEELEALIEAGLAAGQLGEATRRARGASIALAEAVVELGYLTLGDVTRALAASLALPQADLERADPAVAARLPEDFAQSRSVVLVSAAGGRGVLAMADPLDEETFAEADRLSGLALERQLATREAIQQTLMAVYRGGHLARIRDRLRNEMPEDSAHRVLTRRQAVAGVLLAVGLLLIVVWLGFLTTLIAVNAVLTVFYLVANAFKLRLILGSVGSPSEVVIAQEDVFALEDAALPLYTLLVPMYREAQVLPALVDGLLRLDYPPSKLDVKLVLEEDDEETISAARLTRLPTFVQILVTPSGEPNGKPKVCNYGLLHARGELVVIFDAEDRPQPDQLKKVVAAFARLPEQTCCVQAKLGFYNASQNALTRWFTAEYGSWFELMLPGLQRGGYPIPLGGTSNHFLTERLRAAGGWDPYNVTEDADLGIRIHKRGWVTAMLDSVTFEEATSQVPNWIRQRSRWVKGYIQTYLVHMRTRCACGGRSGPGRSGRFSS